MTVTQQELREVREHAVELLRAGQIIERVAEETGLSPSYIYELATFFGISVSHPRRELPGKRNLLILAAWQACKSQAKAARLLGLTRQRVEQVVQEWKLARKQVAALAGHQSKNAPSDARE